MSLRCERTDALRPQNVLALHFWAVLQLEADRYSTSVQLCRDFFTSLSGQVLSASRQVAHTLPYRQVIPPALLDEEAQETTQQTALNCLAIRLPSLEV